MFFHRTSKLRSESSTLCQLCAGIHPAIPRLSQEDSADVGGPGVDYTVNSDCTYSDSSDVITGTGIMQEVNYIFSDGGSGSVAVGILKR